MFSLILGKRLAKRHQLEQEAQNPPKKKVDLRLFLIDY